MDFVSEQPVLGDVSVALHRLQQDPESLERELDDRYNTFSPAYPDAPFGNDQQDLSNDFAPTNDQQDLSNDFAPALEDPGAPAPIPESVVIVDDDTGSEEQQQQQQQESQHDDDNVARWTPLELWASQVRRERARLHHQISTSARGRNLTLPYDEDMALGPNAENNVRARWIEQGIWGSTWGSAWPPKSVEKDMYFFDEEFTMPADYPFPDILDASVVYWGHEQTEETVGSTEFANVDASRPVHHFKYLVEHERRWLEDEIPFGRQDDITFIDETGDPIHIPEGSIEALARQRVRQHWIQDGIWKQEWDVEEKPGLDWVLGDDVDVFQSVLETQGAAEVAIHLEAADVPVDLDDTQPRNHDIQSSHDDDDDDDDDADVLPPEHHFGSDKDDSQDKSLDAEHPYEGAAQSDHGKSTRASSTDSDDTNDAEYIIQPKAVAPAPSHRGERAKSLAVDGPTEPQPTGTLTVPATARRGRPLKSAPATAAASNTASPLGRKRGSASAAATPAAKVSARPGRQGTARKATSKPATPGTARRGRPVSTLFSSPKPTPRRVQQLQASVTASGKRLSRPPKSLQSSPAAVKTAPTPGRRGRPPTSLKATPTVTSAASTPGRRGRPPKALINTPTTATKIAARGRPANVAKPASAQKAAAAGKTPNKRGRPSVAPASVATTSGRRARISTDATTTVEMPTPSQRGRAPKAAAPEQTAEATPKPRGRPAKAPQSVAPVSRKRGRPAQEDDEPATAPPTKRVRTTKEPESVVEPVPRSGRKADAAPPKPTAPAKRGRGAKAIAPKPTAPAKRGRVAKAAAPEPVVPAKRGRGKVANQESKPEAVPGTRKRGRDSIEEVESELPAPKRRGRPVRTTSEAAPVSNEVVEAKLPAPEPRGRPAATKAVLPLARRGRAKTVEKPVEQAGPARRRREKTAQDDNVEVQDVDPLKKRGRGAKKAKPEPAPESAKRGRGRAPKAAAPEPALEDKPAPKKRGRPSLSAPAAAKPKTSAAASRGTRGRAAAAPAKATATKTASERGRPRRA